MDCENCGGTMELDDREAPLHGLCHPCASTALEEALDAFAPFYLHGKALRDAGRLKDFTAEISKQGVSYLAAGAFTNAIEIFEKYGIRKEGKGDA